MRMSVDDARDQSFARLVDQAVTELKQSLRELSLSVKLLSFDGPHLPLAAGSYAPLNFLHLGITEKLERDVPVMRANPFRLLTRLPTLLTTGLSVIIVLFFSPEGWDVASTIGTPQLTAFALFLAMLAGSLGGRADSRDLVRHVLFLDEET